jgi:hypothetical protein
VTVLLAVFGVLLVAGGAGLVYPPAGVIVLGVGALVGAYVRTYLEARR